MSNILFKRVFAGAALIVCSALGAAADITVAVALTPLTAPFFVAEKQGFFNDEGLQVVIKECSGGNVCLKQLLDGQVDLATASDLPIMFRSFERKDHYVLATFATSNRDMQLIARKSAGIKTVKDLEGKRIGLVRGTSGQYFLDLATLAAGLDPRSLNISDLDLKDLEQAAANRQVDAFSVWEPHAYKISRLLGDDAIRLTVAGLYSLSFNLIALRGPNGLADGDQVKFLRALDKAILFMKAQPASTRAILQQRLKLESSEIDTFWPNYRFGLTLNQSLLSTLESEARWAIREQFVKGTRVPDYLDFLEVGPLKQVRPSAVTLVK